MLTLADGRDRIVTVLTKPSGWDNGDDVLTVPLNTLTGTGAIVTSDYVSKSDSRLSATGSKTVEDSPLGHEGSAVVFGASQFEGQYSVFRYFDEDGKIDPNEDKLYAAVGTKGSRHWHFHRIGKKGTAPFVAGDEGWCYEAISDEPQNPSNRDSYIKETVPLGIQKRRKFKVTA